MQPTPLLSRACTRLFLSSVVLGLPACKPKATCQPGEFVVQVVLHPGNPLNPGDDGESLATNVLLLQLADDEPLGRFELDALRADPKAALGESYIAHESFAVWPGADDVHTIRPKADTRYLLLVADYRQILGSTWSLEYEVPRRELHEDAVCTAVHRKRPPLPDPCFYVLLEGYETHGGSTASLAGLRADQVKIRGKPIRCAPPPHQYKIDRKIAKQQARQRRNFDPSKFPTRVPTLPRAAPPSVPPAAPSAAPPTAPTSPLPR